MTLEPDEPESMPADLQPWVEAKFAAHRDLSRADGELAEFAKAWGDRFTEVLRSRIEDLGYRVAVTEQPGHTIQIGAERAGELHSATSRIAERSRYAIQNVALGIEAKDEVALADAVWKRLKKVLQDLLLGLASLLERHGYDTPTVSVKDLARREAISDLAHAMEARRPYAEHAARADKAVERAVIDSMRSAAQAEARKLWGHR